MTENTGSDSSSRLNKIITIEVAVCGIAAFIGYYLIKRVDIDYITLLLAITVISILAVPFTIGLFWHDISLETRKKPKFFIMFLFIILLMQEILKLFQNRIGIIQAILSTVMLMILIYLPFFIGRGINTLRLRLHKS
ncbi:MAG: hypothetical protein ACYC27_23065 [Armatimonadota bacterium]